MRLDDLKPLLADDIQAQAPARQGGRRRALQIKEIMALTLVALGAANRWTGVHWKNSYDSSGAPLAIAILRGAQFGEDETGYTTLNETGEILSHEEIHE